MFQILRELYFDTIRDLYSAETQFLDALPELASQATGPKLRNAFSRHYEEIQDKIERLRTISQRHGFACGGATCETMRLLIREAKSHISKKELSGDGRDAELIARALRIEHYEIAGWGLAQSFAESLSLDDDRDLLHEKSDLRSRKIAKSGLIRSVVSNGFLRFPARHKKPSFIRGKHLHVLCAASDQSHPIP